MVPCGSQTPIPAKFAAVPSSGAATSAVAQECGEQSLILWAWDGTVTPTISEMPLKTFFRRLDFRLLLRWLPGLPSCG